MKLGVQIQVTPPFLKTCQWSANFSASLTPRQCGYVVPRFNNRAVAAMLDGHVENFSLRQMQDMRHWYNTADRADFVLQP